MLIAHAEKHGTPAVDIVVPIIVGLIVLALAVLSIYWFFYGRYTYHHPRRKSSMKYRTPSHFWRDARLQAPRFLFGLIPGTQSIDSRGRKKDSSWEIDEDAMLHPVDSYATSMRDGARGGEMDAETEMSSRRSSMSDSFVFMSNPNATAPKTEHTGPSSSKATPTKSPGSLSPSTLPLSPASTTRTTRHARVGTSSPLLPRFELPSISLFSGPRKGPGYKSARIKPIPHTTQFRLDSLSPETPTRADAGPSMLYAGAGEGAAPRASSDPGAGASARNGLVDARRELGQAREQQREQGQNERSVLLISSAPGEDFVIESTPSSAVDSQFSHGAPVVASPIQE